MQLDTILRALKQDGFCVVPAVADPTQVRALREAVQVALDEENRLYAGLPGKQSDLAVDLGSRGGPFWDLMLNPQVREIFGAVLGPQCILYSFTSTVLFPGESPPAAGIHVDSPRWSADYDLGLVMTLALDDFTDENGATLYLPGSHKFAEPPAADLFYEHSVTVARRAGDAVFFNPRVFHAAGLNRTKAARFGCTMYACRSFMRQRFDYAKMVPQAALADYPPELSGFLGFDVRVPASLAEFYVDPSQRLYKAGQG